MAVRGSSRVLRHKRVGRGAPHPTERHGSGGIRRAPRPVYGPLAGGGVLS